MDKETNEIIKEIFKMYEDMALDSNVLSLIKTLKEWYFEKEEYKERVDKAIKYITSEESIDIFTTIESREQWLKVNKKLLNILRGEK